MKKTATLIGATGLIGSCLLQLLQDDQEYNLIKVLVRREVSFSHPKVKVIRIDFADDAAYKEAIAGSDVVFCAVGTTQKKVKGDLVAYRKVDYDIPVHAARFCAETGCKQLMLVSSVGANSRSNNFYLSLKGEVEDLIGTLNLNVGIFRPSMLVGKREEFRFAEEVSKVLFVPLSFLVPSHYKAIKGLDVARAMVSAAHQNRQGVTVYHFKEMQELIHLIE